MFCVEGFLFWILWGHVRLEAQGVARTEDYNCSYLDPQPPGLRHYKSKVRYILMGWDNNHVISILSHGIKQQSRMIITGQELRNLTIKIPFQERIKIFSDPREIIFKIEK